MILMVHAITGLWAFNLIVMGAMVSNGLSAGRTMLFVFWFVALAVLIAGGLVAVLDKS